MTNYQLNDIEAQIEINKQTQTIRIDTELLEEMIAALRRSDDQAARIEELTDELDRLEREYNDLENENFDLQTDRDTYACDCGCEEV